MSENKNLWFQMKDDETKEQWIISRGRAKELLGILELRDSFDKRIGYTQMRQEEIVEIITECILPTFTKQFIRQFLAEHEGIDTKAFHKFLNCKNSVLARAYWFAKRELEECGEIVSVKQGRGKPKLWYIKGKEKAKTC
jgi:hypothetical protein